MVEYLIFSMIAIVDYKAGNLTSVRLAFESLGAPAEVTRSAEAVRRADRVVFPGVGSAAAAMRTLTDMGLLAALRQVVADRVPFLGICLGTQIVFEDSEEDGGTPCLGILPGKVRRFRPAVRRGGGDKVPQMGWNAVNWPAPHPLFAGIESGSEFYFVHSYYPVPADPRHVLASTDYAGVAFASVVGQGSLFATQFHPEKSGRIGLKLLDNFSRWDGTC